MPLLCSAGNQFLEICTFVGLKLGVVLFIPEQSRTRCNNEARPIYELKCLVVIRVMAAALRYKGYSYHSLRHH